MDGVSGAEPIHRGPRAYLAGPDVFLPSPERWAETKKALCRRYGITGVTPLDALTDEPAAWAALPEWRRIALRNEAHIRGADVVIANLTPFRGPSGDAGTVYELGFARALGLPVFGYTTVATPYLQRGLDWAGAAATICDEGHHRDGDGLLIEAFGLCDNLMIEAGIISSGGCLVLAHCAPAQRWQDLEAFERCLQAVARYFAVPQSRV
jgi:nucleoside 2-deoxyribosyltransferase